MVRRRGERMVPLNLDGEKIKEKVRRGEMGHKDKGKKVRIKVTAGGFKYIQKTRHQGIEATCIGPEETGKRGGGQGQEVTEKERGYGEASLWMMGVREKTDSKGRAGNVRNKT